MLPLSLSLSIFSTKGCLDRPAFFFAIEFAKLALRDLLDDLGGRGWGGFALCCRKWSVKKSFIELNPTSNDAPPLALIISDRTPKSLAQLFVPKDSACMCWLGMF